MVRFVSVVREQKGLFRTGRINSKHLVGFVGKKVSVKVKELKLEGKGV